MTEWQYARVIIRYQGKRTEVKGFWIFKEEVPVQDWIIWWFGPDGEPSVEQQSGTDAVLVDCLNTCGRYGWEMVTGFHSDGQFEYILKRPIRDDSYDA